MIDIQIIEQYQENSLEQHNIDILFNQLQKDLEQSEKQHSKDTQKIADLEKQLDAVTKTTKTTSYDSVMSQSGIKQSDFKYVDYIIKNESNYNPQATNSQTGAYGLCQALPPEKMNKFGDDWKTNPVTQLKWCNWYANNRYGSWKKASEFWKNNGWW